MTEGGDVAKQSQNKFVKRQKELERKRKAEEKMARRHEKKNRLTDTDPLNTDQS
jgi:hypothetical protein